MKYKNYLQTEVVPFSFDSLFLDLKIDSFNAVGFSKKNNLIKLTSKISYYFYHQYLKSINEFGKTTYGEVYSNRTDNFKNINLFAAGRLIPNDSIKTLLILMQEHSVNAYSKPEEIFTLIFYNTKNNYLCSIAEVSYPSYTFALNPNPTSVTYRIGSNSFIFIEYKKGPDYKEYAKRYKKMNDKKRYYYFKNKKQYKFSYCWFYIDEIGYIHFFDRDELFFPEELR